MRLPSWAESFAERLGETVRSVEQIARHPLGTTRVWRVTAESGREYAVKQHIYRAAQTRGGHDALETEAAILSLLEEMRAPTPAVKAVDMEAGYLASEWIHGAPLDDLAQRDPDAARNAAPKALAALEQIERALEARISEAEPYAFDHDYDAYLGADFVHILMEARVGYNALCERIGAAPPAGNADWEAVYAAIQNAQPTMGSLDYNARNLLITPSRAAYLDFSAVGWDWTERRLAHYLYALGARDPSGSFVCALTPSALSESGAVFFDPAALEAHLFVFQCLTAERLLRGGLAPPAQAENADDPYWQNRMKRFEQTAQAVARGALAAFEGTARLRSAVAEKVAAEG